MAAMEESLRDLELIMDANLHCAAAAAAAGGGGGAAAAAAAPNQEDEADAEAEAEAAVAEQEVNPPPHIGSNVASLSLALGSMMSSNFVLSRAGLVVPRSAAFPQQKKSHAPHPVVPSSKVKFGRPEEEQHKQARGAAAALKLLCNSATAFPDYQMLPTAGRGYANPAGGAAMKKASIVWFRNDLRVHDNEALSTAHKESMSVIPVYCFDPRDYGKSSSGFDKTGPYRAKFLLECVSSLRESLRQRGSDLVVRVGNPEEVLSSIAKAVSADGFYAHQEVSADELLVEDKVSAALKDQGVDTKFFWGSTLFHIDDLPFQLENMPSNYGGFRDKVKSVRVRSACQASQQLKGLPSQGDVKPGSIPTLQELGLTPSAATMQDKSAGKGGALIGGEDEALKRLKTFSSDAMPAGDNSIHGTSFSCKISPWLAMGCLSPRKMFEDLKKNTASRFNMQAGQPNDGPGLQWLVCELLWRDFFRFVTKKYGVAKKNQSVAPCGATLAAAMA